jgi:hypothetical protein
MLNENDFRRRLKRGDYHVLTFDGVGRRKFECVRCNRTLGEESFTPVADAFSRSGSRLKNAILLSAVCKRCKQQRFGVWISHPLYSPGLDEFFERRVALAKHGANNRGIFFGISKDDVLGTFLNQEGRCALSGIDLDFKVDGSMENGLHGLRAPSIDRIDSSKDYLPDNIQITSAVINRMKANSPNEAFIELCRLIAVHRGIAL